MRLAGPQLPLPVCGPAPWLIFDSMVKHERHCHDGGQTRSDKAHAAERGAQGLQRLQAGVLKQVNAVGQVACPDGPEGGPALFVAQQMYAGGNDAGKTCCGEQAGVVFGPGKPGKPGGYGGWRALQVGSQYQPA